MMHGRSAIQCLHRWTKILKPGLKKGPWQEEEDERLLEWVKNNGSCKWSLCAENILGRSGKQCRERWFNNLNPNVKKGGWTPDEDESIFRGYLQFSSSWSKIAKNLLGRTENSVKNRFYSTVRKLLADQEKEGGSMIRGLQIGTNNAALHTFVKQQLNKINRFRDPLEINDKEEIFHDENVSNSAENQLINGKDERSNAMVEESIGRNSSDGQQVNLEDDSKSKKKGCDAYPEQNLLYKLLKQQGGPIKRTLCMKDYSTIYKKYKKRYNQKKRDKKLSEKVEILRKLILNRKDDQSLQIQNAFVNSNRQSVVLQKKAMQSDIEKKINQVESELANLSNQQQKQLNRKLSRSDESPSPEHHQAALSQEQIMDFQHRLMEFFNHSLTEVMNKFQQDIGANKNDKSSRQQWQMILAPPDSKIVYPPANMPPDPNRLSNQMMHQNCFIQVPNIVITPKQHTQQQNNFNQVNEIHQVQRSKSKRQALKRANQLNSQVQSQKYENVVGSFFKKFNHLGMMGITQLLPAQVEQKQDESEDQGFQLPQSQDCRIDQKMVFLISQLHTLEGMLSNTKKELGRLEASIHEKITINKSNDSFYSQDQEIQKKEE